MQLMDALLIPENNVREFQRGSSPSWIKVSFFRHISITRPENYGIIVSGTVPWPDVLKHCKLYD